jgi:hypothetical protein
MGRRVKIQLAPSYFAEPALSSAEWGVIQDAFHEGNLERAQVPLRPLAIDANLRKWLATREIECRVFYQVMDFGKRPGGVLPAYSYGAFAEIPSKYALMFKLTFGGR